MIWGLLSYWFCCCGFFNFVCVCVPVALYPFALGSCFLTSVPGLNLLLFSIWWKIYHVCKGRLSYTENKSKWEKVCFSRVFCLKDASKALRKGRSLLCFYLQISQISEFHMSQNTFPVKGKVREKCCQVGLCCFNLNRTIYCFSCRMIWYQIFVAGIWCLCMSLSKILIWY